MFQIQSLMDQKTNRLRRSILGFSGGVRVSSLEATSNEYPGGDDEWRDQRNKGRLTRTWKIFTEGL